MPDFKDEERSGRFVRLRDMKRLAGPSESTLMECPWCDGAGLVTVEKRAEWLAKYPELDPPKDSEPQAPSSSKPL